MSEAAKPRRTAPRSETRQRPRGVFVRLDDREFAKLQERAEKAELSPASYLRACGLGDAGPRARRSPTVNKELAAKAIAGLNKAGSNLNQIAHAIHMSNWPGTASILEATNAVRGAALHILRAFGYKTDDRQGQSA